jgi:hypothetical protein
MSFPLIRGSWYATAHSLAHATCSLLSCTGRNDSFGYAGGLVDDYQASAWALRKEVFDETSSRYSLTDVVHSKSPTWPAKHAVVNRIGFLCLHTYVFNNDKLSDQRTTRDMLTYIYIHFSPVFVVGESRFVRPTGFHGL